MKEFFAASCPTSIANPHTHRERETHTERETYTYTGETQTQIHTDTHIFSLYDEMHIHKKNKTRICASGLSRNSDFSSVILKKYPPPLSTDRLVHRPLGGRTVTFGTIKIIAKGGKN